MIRNTILIILVITICSSISWYFGMRYGVKISTLTRDMIVMSDMEDYMKTTFKQGTCEAVKDATLAFDKQIDRRKEIGDPWYDEGIYHTDKLISYGRIYMIDKKMQNLESANAHLSTAIAACKKLDWQDECTKEKIEDFVSLLLESSPISCLNN